MSIAAVTDPYAQQPTVEDLEARRMMSTVTLDDGGVLVVSGDAARPNAITVTMSKGKIVATAGRAKLAVATAKVLALMITGGAKADVIDVSPAVKLGAWIDARGGNDTVRTGGGNDTVIGGAGNDRVTTRGGHDGVFDPVGKNVVQATRRDTVYGGTGKSRVTGTTNRSLTDADPVIPPPPDAPRQQNWEPLESGQGTGGTASDVQQEPEQQPTTADTGTQQQGGSNQGQTPATNGGGAGSGDQEQPPVVDGVDNGGTTGTGTGTGTGGDSQPPTSTNEPGGLDLSGGGSGTTQQQQQQQQPPAPVGPTLSARDFGAKLDGVTDDTAAIQAALNALPATGGTLALDGVALIGHNGVRVSGKDHVTIRGTVAGAGLKASGVVDGQAVGGFSSVLLVLSRCTNSTVTALTINGGGFANCLIGLDCTTDSVVQGNEVTNTGGAAAIVSIGGTRNQFLGNNVHDTPAGSRGLWIGNVHPGELETDPVISGNVITRTGATGIVTLSTGARIVNNNVTYTSGTGVVLAGVTAVTTTNAYVANNYLCFNGYQGLQADNWSTPGQMTLIGSAVIENNVCNGNAHAGVYCVNATGWTIRGNTCDDNSTAAPGSSGGIVVSGATDVVVEGNTCVDTRPVGTRTQGAGVWVDAWDARGSSSRIRVSANRCDTNRMSGIFLNVLVNNGSAGTIDSIQIDGNNLDGNQRYGLEIAQSQPGLVTNLTVQANTYSGNQSGDARLP